MVTHPPTAAKSTNAPAVRFIPCPPALFPSSACGRPWIYSTHDRAKLSSNPEQSARAALLLVAVPFLTQLDRYRAVAHRRPGAAAAPVYSNHAAGGAPAD